MPPPNLIRRNRKEQKKLKKRENKNGGSLFVFDGDTPFFFFGESLWKWQKVSVSRLLSNSYLEAVGRSQHFREHEKRIAGEVRSGADGGHYYFSCPGESAMDVRRRRSKWPCNHIFSNSFFAFRFISLQLVCLTDLYKVSNFWNFPLKFVKGSGFLNLWIRIVSPFRFIK